MLVLSIIISSHFSLLFTLAFTASKMALEERSQHRHSGGRNVHFSSSSFCPQCSLKLYSGSMVTWLQWTGGWGYCLGWCHKVRMF